MLRKLFTIVGLGLVLACGASAQTKIDLQRQVSGVLPVPNGGSGANSLSGVLKGNGTSAFTPAANVDVIALWTGSCNSGTFLKGDGSCGVPAGGGTVTGATFSGGLISVSGSTTLAFTVAGTSGGIPYFSSSASWASSGALGAGQFVLGGGAGSAPTTSFSVVPVVNGGTGAATLTGPIKGNGTSAFTAAVSADIYGLWTGSCNSGTFLRGDGACAAPAGSGNTTSTSLTTNQIPKANGANSIINSLWSDNGTASTYTGSGGVLVVSGGVSSVLGLGDSSTNCPVAGLTSGTSYICSSSFAPVWITDIASVITTTAFDLASSNGVANGLATLDGTGNVPANQLANFPAAWVIDSTNTTLTISSSVSQFSIVDYGSSVLPTNSPFVVTDVAVTSTDQTTNFVTDTASTSSHESFAARIHGVNQLQVCEQTGPQGETVFGSVVTCPNVYQTTFAKIIMQSSTAAHTIVREWQASSSASGDMNEWNNATLSGTGWYFVRGYSGVSSTDTSNGGGTESFHIRGDGQTLFNTTSATAQYAAWKNTTAALVGASQSSPFIATCGTEWHASASTEGCGAFEFVPGTGTDANSVFALTHTGNATGVMTFQTPGPVASGSDGVHAAYLSLLGNTTAPAITTNTAGWLGPNSASFTAYALQLPSANPSGGQVLSCGTPSSGVSACSWGSGGGVSSVNTLTGTVVIEAATAGQVAISGGSGAALTGASDLTYSGHTFSGITTTIFDLSAATGAGALKLPPVVGGTSLAGTVTANLSAPIVLQNTNSSNNNTSISVGITSPGTSTGQTTLNVNGAATGGDLTDWGTGGTWAAGVLSGQTILAKVAITGAITGLNFTSNGTTSGFVDYPQGSTSSAVAPCNVATSICEQAPTAVTSYLVTKPGAAFSGIAVGINASSVITQKFTGDTGHYSSGAVTIGSGTSIGSTSLCSTTDCPAGNYQVNVYADVTTACTTTGTYVINLIYTDDTTVSKTVPIPIDGTGVTFATGTLALASTTNFGTGQFFLHSTGAASINYSTTAGACGTGGPAVGKFYLTVVPLS